MGRVDKKKGLNKEGVGMELVEKRKGEEAENRKSKEEGRSQSRFIMDLRHDKKGLEKVLEALKRVNEKDYGDEVSFKDLCLFAINKLGEKDVERIKDESMTDMEKVEIARKEFNEKSGSTLSLAEFLVKKLNLN